MMIKINKIDYEILITAGKLLIYLLNNNLLKDGAITDENIKYLIEKGINNE